MSVGYTSPINGSNVAFQFLVVKPANSGGAIRGYMPQQTQNVDKRYPEFEQIRFALKNAWNTSYRRQLKADGLSKSMVTPFRAVNNSGDLLCRDNYSCGGTCQSFQSRPNMRGLRQRFGSISDSCIPSAAYNSLQLLTNIPASACNVKYVYDSSDYITYLKQKAVNKNYNDLTYGGDQSNSSQTAIKAIRRY
jgi:hypothetical protein